MVYDPAFTVHVVLNLGPVPIPQDVQEITVIGPVIWVRTVTAARSKYAAYIGIHSFSLMRFSKLDRRYCQLRKSWIQKKIGGVLKGFKPLRIRRSMVYNVVLCRR